MQRILFSGAIGLVSGAAGFLLFLMILSGGPMSMLMDYGDNTLPELTFMLPPLLAGFVAGLVYGALKVPVRYLLFVIPFIPVAAFVTYFYNMHASRPIAQLIIWGIIPLEVGLFLLLPTLLHRIFPKWTSR